MCACAQRWWWNQTSLGFLTGAQTRRSCHECGAWLLVIQGELGLEPALACSPVKMLQTCAGDASTTMLALMQRLFTPVVWISTSVLSPPGIDDGPGGELASCSCGDALRTAAALNGGRMLSAAHPEHNPASHSIFQG